MVYTRSTPDNSAVSALIAGGSCRVRAHGEAPLKAKAGSYLVRIAVGERTDSASALLSIYDSGNASSAVGVRLLTGTAGITDDGQSITATALESWSSDGNQEYAFEVTLPEPTGEWVLSLRTDESSAAVPMDFSGWHLEDTLQRGTALVGAGDIATSALGRCRYAAFGGKGASGTGAFGTVSWNITAGANISWRFVVASAIAPSAEVMMLGNSDADNRMNVRIHTNGALRIYNRNTLLAETAAGAVAFNGYPFDVQGTITPTTATATVNGVLVLSATFATQSWVTGSAYNWQICGIAPTSGQHWPGSIQLAELLDNTTPANSIRLLMDEPSGNYANTYPGTTAAASATRNGLVCTCPVLSLDGRGMPWQGAPAPLIYQARRTSALALTGATTYTPVLNTEDLDPTGSMANGSLTAPVAGMAICTWSGTIRATSLAAPPDMIGLSIVAGGVTIAEVQVSVTATNMFYPFCVRAARLLTAAQTADGRISRIDSAADAWSLEVACFTVEFYPTPTTG